MRRRDARSRGFTLLETVVAIAALLLLSALVLPALRSRLGEDEPRSAARVISGAIAVAREQAASRGAPVVVVCRASDRPGEWWIEGRADPVPGELPGPTQPAEGGDDTAPGERLAWLPAGVRVRAGGDDGAGSGPVRVALVLPDGQVLGEPGLVLASGAAGPRIPIRLERFTGLVRLSPAQEPAS